MVLPGWIVPGGGAGKGDLISQVETFRTRYGYYLEVVLDVPIALDDEGQSFNALTS